MQQSRKAFTLIEILIVIAIIGILTVALLPRIQGAQSSARNTARKADLNQIATALAAYNGDAGRYPENLDELA
ncbi:prepilin-type N-terminal cleavage/methylation domain-containing protein [Patescibacteria group bacterium]|nr:prepilin-type N-terminal cleavage/methylation domain-containing protein [Patescibacteria group bacterium]